MFRCIKIVFFLSFCAFLITGAFYYDSEKLNENIERYMPVYVQRVFTPSIHVGNKQYKYFKLNLKNPVKVSPVPWSVHEGTFLGYADDETEIEIEMYDDSHTGLEFADPMGFSSIVPLAIIEGLFEEFAQKPEKVFGPFKLTPGAIYEDNLNFSETLLNLKLSVELKELDIKVKEEGFLKDTFGPTPAYLLNLEISNTE